MNTIQRLTTMLIVATWLGGCSFMDEVDTTELPSPLPELAQDQEILRPLWTAANGVGVAGQFLRLRPIVLGGRVVVANADGEVLAYDSYGGELSWHTTTDIDLSGGAGGGDELVVVGGAEGEVVALNLKDGKEQWRTALSSEILAPPVVAEGIVVVRTLDGHVTGLAASDGSRLWVFSRTVPSLTLRGTSAPIIVHGQIFVGLDSGHLVALRLQDGGVEWETIVAVPKGRSELERMVDIDADPVWFDGILYVAAFQGRVVAVDAKSGQLRWARDISSLTGLGVDRTHVYVTDEESVVWGLDRFSGSALWRQEGLRYRALTAPIPYGHAVVTGDLDGYLHALNQEDGRLLGRFYLGSAAVLTTPLTQGAVLYAINSSGAIAALRE